MATTAPVPAPEPRAIAHGGPRILVLGASLLVVIGALVCSLLFFTAGLVLVPLLIGGFLLYGLGDRRERQDGASGNRPPTSNPPTGA